MSTKFVDNFGYRHRLIGGRKIWGSGKVWPVDDDDRNAKRSCRSDLAITGGAAGVFANDNAYCVLHQHLPFVILNKGAARGKVSGARDIKRRLDRIDAADDIVMLRGCFKGQKFLASEREKHGLRFFTKSCDSVADTFHRVPAIAALSFPGRAAQGNQRHFGNGSGLYRIGGNPRRIGMCGVDQCVDVILFEEGCQAFRPAKPAGAHRHGLGDRIACAPGQRQKKRVVGVFRQFSRQNAGIRRSTKNEYGAFHGH